MKRTPLVRKTGLKPKRKTKQSTLKNQADKYARDFVMKRDLDCVAANFELLGRVIHCTDRCEWAHLKSRSHATIRHDPRNAVKLCWAHHKFFTNHPDLWTQFIEKLYPGRWQELNVVLQRRVKPDYQFWIDYYKEVAA